MLDVTCITKLILVIKWVAMAFYELFRREGGGGLLKMNVFQTVQVITTKLSGFS